MRHVKSVQLHPEFVEWHPAELLREAEKLIASKMHPQTIIAGWRMAVDCSRNALAAAARNNG